jgi:histidine triad (HIT) family protein
MSLNGVYKDDNVFALILQGKLPNHTLWEDDATLAFLDVNPQGQGHSLVISKTSLARNILEIEPAALCAVMTTVQRVAIGLRAALRPDGLHIAQFNGGDTGQSVFHLHVHIVPRWAGKELGILSYYDERGRRVEQADLAALAAEIRPFVAAASL